eukprot:Hpha_TRINITY_DN15772_c1_g2::TRINITY_DN15772_c1_g2_i3::g.41182::m.41182
MSYLPSDGAADDVTKLITGVVIALASMCFVGAVIIIIWLSCFGKRAPEEDQTGVAGGDETEAAEEGASRSPAADEGATEPPSPGAAREPFADVASGSMEPADAAGDTMTAVTNTTLVDVVALESATLSAASSDAETASAV